MADGLRDLLNKTMDSFSVPCVAGLVLDEDGTGVETEDFFQTLKDSTVLMVLEKGQKWSPQQGSQLGGQAAERKTQHRKDLAKLTLDFYKNHPKEFIGCLNVQMTLYGMYSLSYDLQCYHAKRMLREALRWTLFSMQATGHVLLGTSYYMQHLIDEDEKAEAQLTASSNTIKPLQAIQWKKSAVDYRN
ncbi:Cell death activator CIDE-3 [Bagarius yarrelli]|uniref:Cell death activator CIDE-3 n=1 Tax=Bagarius yarrelli TaxID=175774 RepID=A0A556VXZ9_BAGYA|nr:Cell death activator CIDE-3 [Bagarius yarrelli]